MGLFCFESFLIVIDHTTSVLCLTTNSTNLGFFETKVIMKFKYRVLL